MRTMLAVLAVAATSLATSATADEAPLCQNQSSKDSIGVRPDLYYGDKLTFNVLRNGTRVGRHETVFSQEDGVLKVTSEMELKVKVLFVTAYRFTYDSVSYWCDGAMTRIEASINDNGKARRVTVVTDSDGVSIDGPQGKIEVDDKVPPTEHWNSALLEADRVINTLNGRVANVDVTAHGATTVETTSGSIPARHYSYSGEFVADVWYDDAGRWVKLRMVTNKDNSVIEYICDSCRTPDRLVDAKFDR